MQEGPFLYLDLEGVCMCNAFEGMYFLLFNSITDALRELEAGNGSQAVEILKAAQQGAEEIYMQGDETMPHNPKTGER